MVLFICGIKNCKFSTNEINTFLFHHDNHPDSDRNKFLCNFDGCYTDCGDRKKFRAHCKTHLINDVNSGK